MDTAACLWSCIQFYMVNTLIWIQYRALRRRVKQQTMGRPSSEKPDDLLLSQPLNAPCFVHSGVPRRNNATTHQQPQLSWTCIRRRRRRPCSQQEAELNYPSSSDAADSRRRSSVRSVSERKTDAVGPVRHVTHAVQLVDRDGDPDRGRSLITCVQSEDHARDWLRVWIRKVVRSREVCISFASHPRWLG